MRLSIDVEIKSVLSANDPALLMVEVNSAEGQSVLTSDLTVEKGTVAGGAGSGLAWVSVPDRALDLRYRALVDITRPKARLNAMVQTPLPLVPLEVLPFLRPSRYCPSDLFSAFAQQTFGDLQGGAKVVAIHDWIAQNLAYVPGTSSGATTAMETFCNRQGVCRDFAHVFCTLARASQIPTRYASTYGAEVVPQDFHAVAQVWLEGAWHLVDATNMGAPHEMAVIATGRDAADVAFMETAHWARLNFLGVSVRKA